jgi:glycosyltransferase involved in cell wall biosynthesis
VRILHISTRLIVGGSQENTVLSCEGQARRGHDVHLAFGPIYGPEGSMLGRAQSFRTADGRGIATHTVPNLVRDVRPGVDRAGMLELRALIRTLRPDIVHTHSSKAGILGRLAAWSEFQGSLRDAGINRRAGRAGDWKDVHTVGAEVGPGIVHTIHGPPFMPLEGSPPRRAKTALTNLLYTLAERRAAKRCHAIVSVADAMTREFLRRGIGRAEQYTTVYSGMEVDRYLSPAPGESRAEMRAALGLAPGDFLIGTVARLAEHKGHDDLLGALGEDLVENERMKLLWVGDGWWRERLLERVRGMGLSVAELDRGRAAGGAGESGGAQVILTGLLPTESVPAWMRAMDILAHPSYREGLPRTVPQALLCGVAPVAYDVDGTGEVCRDGETGRLVPVGSCDGLREAVLWMMEHAAERAGMAARGREECRVRFSAERMVDELEKVYARALAQARGGAA